MRKIAIGVASSFLLIACADVLGIPSDRKLGAVSGDAATGQCSVNADCNADFTICRKDTRTCAKLLSAECTRIEGDYKSDNAVIIGGISSNYDGDNSGIMYENAVALALSEFTTASNGLPAVPGSGKGTRPLVFVGCNDKGDEDTALLGATHLVDTVGVPAIIGAAYSGITRAVATTVTIPKKVLLISPSATSIALTALQDDGLVWRASPSDVLQAAAVLTLWSEVEVFARTKFALPASTRTKVFIGYKDDSYGKGLADAVKDRLTVNGVSVSDPANASNVKTETYGDPDSSPPTAAYSAHVDQILALKPHVVMLFGGPEALSEVIEKVELGWTGTEPRPYYLLTDGVYFTSRLDSLLNNVKAKTTTLASRLIGTIPGTSNANYNKFVSNYNANAKYREVDPNALGGAGSYDSAYMLAFSIAGLGARPVSGPSIAAGLSRLVPPGDKVDPGQNNINGVLQKLASSETAKVDYDGASGPLDFDLATGEAPSDIRLWCIGKTGGVEAPTQNTGVIWLASTKAMNVPAMTTLQTACNWP
jgi:ABC-type branched-subunit amino acid transport system substrate-binding protein